MDFYVVNSPLCKPLDFSSTILINAVSGINKNMPGIPQTISPETTAINVNVSGVLFRVIFQHLFLFRGKTFHSAPMDFFKYAVYFLLLICFFHIIPMVDSNGI